MRYVPHEYQEYAKEFIVSHKVSALFLDCGLGKTVITLTAIWELLFDYFDIRKILIIGPLRVSRDTWPAELAKWDHLSGVGIAGAVKSGFDAAINFIKELPSQALQWGKDIIGGLINGIKSKISGLVDSVKDIAGTIASFLHFSEPDEGPLSNFTLLCLT